MKQKNIPWLGAFMESFFVTLPLLSIINFWAIIVMLYTNLRPYLLQYMPWMNLWYFVAILTLIGVLGMVLVYKFVLPSIWAFRGKQMFTENSGISNRNGVRVAISGGFDPIHTGHTRYIKAALELGNWLIVILSSDEVLKRKKGMCFMPYEERREIIEAILNGRGEVVPNNNPEGLDCVEALKSCNPSIYAKGGDTWNTDNLPECSVCREMRIKIMFGVGGFDKTQSSSNLIGRVYAKQG
jgi:D-beta-D-heptose 7-phosphate kinase/D-beta-D-heptose 1-phosphate adenosyltransferase